MITLLFLFLLIDFISTATFKTARIGEPAIDGGTDPSQFRIAGYVEQEVLGSETFPTAHYLLRNQVNGHMHWFMSSSQSGVFSSTSTRFSFNPSAGVESSLSLDIRCNTRPENSPAAIAVCYIIDIYQDPNVNWLHKAWIALLPTDDGLGSPRVQLRTIIATGTPNRAAVVPFDFGEAWFYFSETKASNWNEVYGGGRVNIFADSPMEDINMGIVQSLCRRDGLPVTNAAAWDVVDDQLITFHSGGNGVLPRITRSFFTTENGTKPSFCDGVDLLSTSISANYPYRLRCSKDFGCFVISAVAVEAFVDWQAFGVSTSLDLVHAAQSSSGMDLLETPSAPVSVYQKEIFYFGLSNGRPALIRWAPSVATFDSSFTIIVAPSDTAELLHIPSSSYASAVLLSRPPIHHAVIYTNASGVYTMQATLDAPDGFTSSPTPPPTLIDVSLPPLSLPPFGDITLAPSFNLAPTFPSQSSAHPSYNSDSASQSNQDSLTATLSSLSSQGQAPLSTSFSIFDEYPFLLPLIIAGSSAIVICLFVIIGCAVFILGGRKRRIRKKKSTAGSAPPPRAYSVRSGSGTTSRRRSRAGTSNGPSMSRSSSVSRLRDARNSRYDKISLSTLSSNTASTSTEYGVIRPRDDDYFTPAAPAQLDEYIPMPEAPQNKTEVYSNILKK